jgi:hypothetical protein
MGEMDELVLEGDVVFGYPKLAGGKGLEFLAISGDSLSVRKALSSLPFLVIVLNEEGSSNSSALVLLES